MDDHIAEQFHAMSRAFDALIRTGQAAFDAMSRIGDEMKQFEVAEVAALNDTQRARYVALRRGGWDVCDALDQVQ